MSIYQWRHFEISLKLIFLLIGGGARLGAAPTNLTEHGHQMNQRHETGLAFKMNVSPGMKKSFHFILSKFSFSFELLFSLWAITHVKCADSASQAFGFRSLYFNTFWIVISVGFPGEYHMFVQNVCCNVFSKSCVVFPFFSLHLYIARLGWGMFFLFGCKLLSVVRLIYFLLFCGILNTYLCL